MLRNRIRPLLVASVLVLLATMLPMGTARAVGTASISGVLKDAAGAPVTNAVVMIYSAGFYYANVVSDANGTYTFTNVDAGTYTLTADPYQTSGYFTQYYDNASDQASETPIPVADGQSVVLNSITMHRSGLVLGRFTGPKAAVSFLQMTLVGQSSGQLFYTNSDADGKYRILLPADTYTVHAYDYQDLSEPRVLPIDNLTFVVGGIDSTTNVPDFAVQPAAAIRGQVKYIRRNAYVPLTSQETAYAYQNGVLVKSVWMNGSASFDLGGLAPGKYKVLITSDDMNWDPVWYPGTPSESQATEVTASGGSAATLPQFNVYMYGRTPATAPKAPNGLSVALRKTTATFTWHASRYNGYSPLVNYRVGLFAKASGGSPVRTCSAVATPPTLPATKCQIAGLRVGTYFAAVTATNRAGLTSTSAGPRVRVIVTGH
jgi:hypothetical protein